MEQEHAIRLLLRQLKDIQAQSDKILGGEQSDEAIEAFSKYSIELKKYIAANITAPEIVLYLKELPEINYSRTQVKLWQYLILPSWGLHLYKNYHAKNKTMEEISMVRGKYASLTLLVGGLVK
ncbi:hypothetical protein DBR32_02730 [Taibaiella sp. KBW10]|uniref:hypothetical protein n=1 Tax=Taibaiella sp. KBW10 TaxID=2153357 RepID=UPI000F598A8C|nr:hypothetical protein [Taibaiella sp. KBW10]RQO32534.1 hypothetical protein DBR32_02730 [Taibaiella sp. KBW10]